MKSKTTIIILFIISIYSLSCDNKYGESASSPVNPERSSMRSGVDWKVQIKTDPHFKDLIKLRKEMRDAIAYNELMLRTKIV
jgi:hypothetical protein